MTDITCTTAPAASTLSRITGDVRDALQGKQHDYTTGPIGQAIFLLAIPMVLEMVMESLFARSDVFFVARLGAAAVATVGLTESMMIVVYTLAMGLSISGTAVVARRIGEKDADGAGRAAVQAILLGALIATAIAITGALLAPTLLRFMGAGDDVLATGTMFTRVMLGGSVTTFLLFVVNATFRGAGDAAVSMRVMWLANAINIALGPMLIFGVFAPAIVRGFTADPAVTDVAVDGLRLMALGFPLFAFGMVLTQSFNGAGDTATPTRINIGVFWAFEIPLAWALARFSPLGFHAIFASITAAYSVLAVVSFVMFRRGTWRSRQV